MLLHPVSSSRLSVIYCLKISRWWLRPCPGRAGPRTHGSGCTDEPFDLGLPDNAHQKFALGADSHSCPSNALPSRFRGQRYADDRGGCM